MLKADRGLIERISQIKNSVAEFGGPGSGRHAEGGDKIAVGTKVMPTGTEHDGKIGEVVRHSASKFGTTHHVVFPSGKTQFAFRKDQLLTDWGQK